MAKLHIAVSFRLTEKSQLGLHKGAVLELIECLQDQSALFLQVHQFIQFLIRGGVFTFQFDQALTVFNRLVDQVAVGASDDCLRRC